MFCRKCGTSNDDNAFRCVSCGAVVQDAVVIDPSSASDPVPNYLVHSILATLFCCMPAGVVAIVYAAQVNPRLQAGDRAGAIDASRKAKNWLIGAVAIGLVVVVFYGLVIVLAEAR